MTDLLARGTFAEPARQRPVSISVVISAYTDQRWTQLGDAIASVENQACPARELVVVVDSNAPLLQRLQAARSDVIVVPNTHRPGLAGARNSGAEHCTADVIAYLDDDARADPGWLRELTRAYEADGLLGVGGQITPEWATVRPRWFPAEFDWVVGCTYRGMPTSPEPVRNPIGANMSILRTVFDAIGGFREELGRLEETEISIRARKHFPDRVWLHWPAALVHHQVSPERERWNFFLRRCHNEGLAKATMVRITSREAGLASERRYVRRVLPAGVLRGVQQGLQGDHDGLRRSGAIVAGLGATVLGYARGLARLHRGGSGAPEIPRRGHTP